MVKLCIPEFFSSSRTARFDWREPDDLTAIFFDGPAGDLKKRGLSRSGRPLDIGEIRPATHGLNSGFLPIVQPWVAGDFSGNGPVSHRAGGFLAEALGGFQGLLFHLVENLRVVNRCPCPRSTNRSCLSVSSIRSWICRGAIPCATVATKTSRSRSFFEKCACWLVRLFTAFSTATSMSFAVWSGAAPDAGGGGSAGRGAR